MKSNNRYLSALSTYDINNQRVFVRADLNVPIKDGSILDDHRLKAVLPTLEHIKEKGGRIILATHRGRPKKLMPELSTKQLVPWLKENGFSVQFEADLEKAGELSTQLTSDILLLENLRFFPGETTGDQTLAQQLKQCADFYVNDAFGLLHRADTSVTLLPQLFAQDKRTIGLLVEQELCCLDAVLHEPDKPFVLVIGGGKVKDKLPLVLNLLDKIDTLLLCPAPVFTFIKANGGNVGASLVDATSFDLVKQIEVAAEQHNVRLVFPLDYQVARKNIDGPLAVIAADEFASDDVGISIGPKTIKAFTQEIMKAGTIFFNGISGFLERPETLNSTKELFTTMAQAPGVSIIAGGDSAATARMFGFKKSIDYLSTGGGATLAYASGQELPGLKVLVNRTKTK